MKIKETKNSEPVNVYGFYWGQYNGKFERMYLVIPEPEYPGFIAKAESECELVDNTIDNFCLIKTGVHNEDMIVHQILSDTGLLYRLIDHDPDAMADFISRLADSSNKVVRGKPTNLFLKS